MKISSITAVVFLIYIFNGYGSEKNMLKLEVSSVSKFIGNDFDVAITCIKNKDQNLPEIEREGLSVSFGLPKDAPENNKDVAIRLGGDQDFIWKKISDKKYRMVLKKSSLHIKGKWDLEVTFNYSVQNEKVKFSKNIELNVQ